MKKNFCAKFTPLNWFGIQGDHNLDSDVGKDSPIILSKSNQILIQS